MSKLKTEQSSPSIYGNYNNEHLPPDAQLEYAKVLFGIHSKIKNLAFLLNGVCEIIEDVYNKTITDSSLKKELFASLTQEDGTYNSLDVVEIVSLVSKLIKMHNSYKESNCPKRKAEFSEVIKTINFDYKVRQKACEICADTAKDIAGIDTVIKTMLSKHLPENKCEEIFSVYQKKRNSQKWLDMVEAFSHNPGFKLTLNHIRNFEVAQGQTCEVIIAISEQVESLKLKMIESRDILITSNTKLVLRIAHKLAPKSPQMADFVQEGMLGLMHATEMFNPYIGTRFITFAYYWISQSIVLHWHATQSVIAIPARVRQQGENINKLYLKHKAFEMEGDANQYVAKELGMTVEALHATRQNIYASSPKQQNPNIGSDGQDDLIDPFDSIDNNEPPIGDTLEMQERNEFLEDMYELATPQEKTIWDMRLSSKITEKLKLSDFKERTAVKVSGERIRQIENKLIGKLKKEAENRFVDNADS